MKRSICDGIDSALSALNYNESIPAVRQRIAGLMLQTLPEVELAGTYWAKSAFIKACRAFHANVNRREPTLQWLRLVLVELRDVFQTPASDKALKRDHEIERLTFERITHMAHQLLLPYAAIEIEGPSGGEQLEMDYGT